MDDAPERYEPQGPGTITDLQPQRKNPHRLSVFLDGAFAFGVYQDVVLEQGLYPGQRLSVEDQQAVLAADQYHLARARALHFLAHRGRTEEEVRRKLRQVGFGEAVTEQTLDRLRELGYLNDAAYARAYTQARYRSRGYGPRRIRDELRRRGVSAPLIDEALAELAEQADPLEAARRHARRRWRRLVHEPDAYKRRRKLSDFLVRRGFEYDVIRQLVEELERDDDLCD
ncbi:MAG: RecX family transcriptional regulator [Bacteroidota bacterium]